MWQIPLQFVSGLIQFGLVNFPNVTNVDVRVNGFLVAVFSVSSFCRRSSRDVVCPIAG